MQTSKPLPHSKQLPSFFSDVFLAPMADITDLAFRLLCRSYGAGLSSTEMVSANDLAREEKGALRKIDCYDEEIPRVIQLYGVNVNNLIAAAKLVEGSCQIIDLNFSCPDEKIVAQGAGSAMMQRPEKIREIVKAVSSAVNIPVSCKLRLGFNFINILEIAKICEEAGASMLIIHGRTRVQQYFGTADWSWIKKVKETVSIPVCGNGDVRSVEEYMRMKKETGCDYVMIGRGAVGNPYLFQQIKDYNEMGHYSLLSMNLKIDALLEYLRLSKEFKVSFNSTKYLTMLFLERIKWTGDISRALDKTKHREEIEEMVKGIV